MDWMANKFESYNYEVLNMYVMNYMDGKSNFRLIEC
jgi:hypothetical protein